MPREAHDEDEDVGDEKLGKFLDDLPDAEGDPDPEDEDAEGEEDEDDEDTDGDEDAVEDRRSAITVAQVAPARRPTPPPAPPRPREPRAPRETPLPANPRGVRGPRSLSPEQVAQSPGFASLRKTQESAYQAIDEVLSNLNFATREYKVRLERVAPQRTSDNIDCSGFLEEYTDNVTTADIKSSYGGGTFHITIHGPHPTTGRPGIIKNEKFKIAGPAKMPQDHDNYARRREQEAEDAREESAMTMKQLLEAQERSQSKVIEVMEKRSQQPDIVDKLGPLLAPFLEKLLNKEEKSVTSMIELQKVEREERRAEEDRRREDERRREDDRRREEAKREEQLREERRVEEQRRREDEARRLEEMREARRIEEERRKEEREERRREEERRRDDERQRREDEREARRREDVEKQRLYDLQQQQALDRQKWEREQAMMQMKLVQEGAQQHSNMLAESFKFQVETMKRNADSGGFESVAKQLMALKELSGVLSGGNDSESSSLVDKIGDLGERLVMPLTQQLMAARRSQQPQQQQQQPQAVMVDLGPKPVQPTQPQLPAPQQNPNTPTALPPAQTDPLANDLTEVPTLPPKDLDLIAAGGLLLKNIDLAFQRDWSAEDVVEKILEPFEELAPMLMSMAKGLDDEKLGLFIESNLPSNWAIRSPRGDDFVKEVFDMWKDEVEEDDMLEAS
jgi:hypothetical protein